MLRNVKKTIGMIVLLVLLAAVVIFGIRIASLVDKTLEEAATTPTPVPAFGNVMQITPDPNAPTPEPVLRSGSQGENVVELQRRLQELGYYQGTLDGQYGPGTRAAVVWFQQEHGLTADGSVGTQTRAVLESANAHRAPVTTSPTPEQTPAAATTMPTDNNVQAASDYSALANADVLRSGSQGAEVQMLQRRLKELGYYSGTLDGQFGAGTYTAVVWFQREHGLEADGIAGTKTHEMLASAKAKRAPETPTPMPELIVKDTVSLGLLILVNRSNAVPESYQPADLVDMSTYCDASVVIIKESGTRAQRVAVDALMTMLRAAHQDGITVWQVSEGYRTRETQQMLFDQQVEAYMRDNNLGKQDAISATRLTVAEPGTSEHHTGLAFDITVPGTYFRDTQQAKWLAEHCWDYGFVIRYTVDKQEITGYLAEPWHIRYVGVDAARRMRDENLCLEEYLAKYNQ